MSSHATEDQELQNPVQAAFQPEASVAPSGQSAGQNTNDLTTERTGQIDQHLELTTEDKSEYDAHANCNNLQDSITAEHSPVSRRTISNQVTDLLDLPSLTPSKSTSDSESDSIPDGFTDDDDEDDEAEEEDNRTILLDSLNLKETESNNTNTKSPTLRTPASISSNPTTNNNQNSLSEPGPTRNQRISRKRSLSELVALRYRGGKCESEIGDEERGLLALDLGTYINSGDPDLPPETKPVPPSGLFPTLESLINNTPPPSTITPKNGTIKLNHRNQFINTLPSPPPRSEWPFGGTGPGKTSRGFIPGRTSSKTVAVDEKEN